jgi:hypothetical protein
VQAAVNSDRLGGVWAAWRYAHTGRRLAEAEQGASGAIDCWKAGATINPRTGLARTGIAAQLK